MVDQPSRLGCQIVGSVSTGLVWFATYPATVRAHETHPYHGGAPVTIGAVLALSVVAGVLLGGAVVLAGTGRWRWLQAVIGRGFGPMLVMLGLAYAIPTVRESVIQSAIGGLGGAFGVWLLSTQMGGENHATAAIGALLAHRTVEGVVLATGYLAGSAVGLAGALLIAGHAAVESAAVGGLAMDRGRNRALLAVLVIQGAFVASALVGTATVVAVPSQFHVFVLAVGAGALCAVGVIESIGHVRPGLVHRERPTG